MRPLDSLAICIGACALFAGCMIVGFRAAPHLSARVIVVPHTATAGAGDRGALGPVLSDCAGSAAPSLAGARDSSAGVPGAPLNATVPLCRPHGSTTFSRFSSPLTGGK
jgi:hypothetical protein